MGKGAVGGMASYVYIAYKIYTTTAPRRLSALATMKSSNVDYGQVNKYK